jgi:alkylated DNA repair dioxygenase AlkB
MKAKLGGWFEHYLRWVKDSDAVLESLLEETPLRQDTIVIYGREVRMPRLTAWIGDASYTYSGKRFVPGAWTTTLLGLRERLERDFGVHYNSVLVNYYRDGRDSIGEHADDEPELGPSREDVRIASISLGAPRSFVLRSEKETFRFELGEGDLFLMGGDLQRRHTHYIPKTKRFVGPRLNLTFRVISEV